MGAVSLYSLRRQRVEGVNREKMIRTLNITKAQYFLVSMAHRISTDLVLLLPLNWEQGKFQRHGNINRLFSR